MPDSGIPVENSSNNGLRWLSYALAGLAIVLCIIVYLLWHRTTELSSQYDSLPSSNTGQDLSLSGSELSLTGRNSVDLSDLFVNNKLQATITGSDLTVTTTNDAGQVISTTSVNIASAIQPGGYYGPVGPNGSAGVQGSSGVAIAQNGLALAGSVLELGTNQLLHDTAVPQNGYDFYFDASANNGSLIAIGNPGDEGGILAGNPGPGNPLSISGAGERFIWYPRKLALRVGMIDNLDLDFSPYGGGYYAPGTAWDDANIGIGSVAIGYDVVAKGNFSSAIGVLNDVEGNFSSVLGAFNVVAGEGNVAIGGLNKMTGLYSINLGLGRLNFLGPGTCFTETSGQHSFNVGECNLLASNHSTVIGRENTVGLAGQADIGVIGNDNVVEAPDAFVIGEDNYVSGLGFAALIGKSSGVSGTNSLAIGVGVHVDGDKSFAIGQSITLDAGADNSFGINVDDVTPVTMSNPNVIGFFGGKVAVNNQNPTYRFEVTDTSTNQPAAFTGTTQTCIVDTSGAGGWNCTSDARLKENIMDLSGSLDKLLQLQGVTYNFKSDLSGSPIAGFVAQEVQKILPSLVGQDPNGYLNLNKDGMIPYIVEAIKEQNGKIDGINSQLLGQGVKLESFSEQLKLLSAQVVDHEDRIKLLEKQNTDKEARIDALEKKVNQVPVTPVVTP